MDYLTQQLEYVQFLVSATCELFQPETVVVAENLVDGPGKNVVWYVVTGQPCDRSACGGRLLQHRELGQERQPGECVEGGGRRLRPARRRFGADAGQHLV